jgi:uncharacterized protein (TIGR03435 family)
MTKHLLLVVVPLATAIASASAQAPISQPFSRPTFEVASVKRNNDPNAPVSMRVLPDRFTMTNAPVRLLINAAYTLATYQYIGMPNWPERYDIAAKAPDGVAPDQMPLMLQSLLADRFKMVARRETRDSPIYALVVSRSDRRLGSRLTKSTIDCAPILARRAAAARARGPGPIPVPQRAPGERPECGARMIGRGAYSAGNTTMPKLAEFLAGYVGRQVVDRTDLQGEFDLDLEFSPQASSLPPSPGAAASLDDAASVFTALQEQLGLKLEPTRGPVEFLVIESVEKPSDD